MALIARLAFEATTPLWPGGPIEGKTYHCLPGGRCLGPFLPDPKSIVGRIRWLLRTAEASAKAVAGRVPASYKGAEKTASRLFGSTSSASKIVLRLRYEDTPQPFINARPTQLGQQIPHTQGLEVLGYELLFNLDITPFLSRKAKQRRRDAIRWVKRFGEPGEWAAKLMTVPRILLTWQNAKRIRDLYEKQPLRPGFKLVIEFHQRLGASLSLVEKEAVVLATVITLTYLGVGKAASRGFGRFRLLYNESQWPESTNLNESLRRIADNPVEAFADAACTLIRLAAGLAEVRDPRIELCPLGQDDIKNFVLSSRIPLLVYAASDYRAIVTLKHPCPYPLAALTQVVCRKTLVLQGSGNNRDSLVIKALSAIGKATLKVVWKNYTDVDVQKPGVGFHTWILGLPRHVSRSTKRDEKTWKVFESGYVLLPKNYLCPNDTCDPNCTDAHFKEPRRASPIVLSPHPSRQGFSLLILPFLSILDFKELLEGSEDTQNGHQGLYHLGKHRRGPKHLVNVKHALQTQQATGDKNCRSDGKSKLSDTAGIRDCRSGQSKPCKDEVTECIHRVARVALDCLIGMLG